MLAILLAVASTTENQAQREEMVATRLLLSALHRIEDGMRGDHGSVEIRVFTIGDASCATRSPLLCQISLATERNPEITEYACPKLYQQVLQMRRVVAIEAVRINKEPNGRISDLENIIEPLGDPPPPPIPLCR
jgi:hypothetical protein